MYTLKKILQNKINCKSVWFMRQAGRYLPEFREIRLKNPEFIKLCLNSELSSIITLQPINRFDLDSAIIFSDILLVPHALGQHVNFTKNNGPKLSELNINSLMEVNKKEFSKKLSPVYKAIEITRKKLSKDKSLIGFIGAPWTLLVYMFDLKNNNNEINLNKFNEKKEFLKKIRNELIEYLCIHIKNQINAGADVIQIFDSWAGLVPSRDFNEYCIEPNKMIVDFCKQEKIPVICFPKGIRERYENFNNLVRPEGINIDYDIDPDWAKKNLKNVVIQGGLDPNVLLRSEEETIQEATLYIKKFRDIPYIFNLGHGLLPETDPDRLEKLIKHYRNS